MRENELIELLKGRINELAYINDHNGTQFDILRDDFLKLKEENTALNERLARSVELPKEVYAEHLKTTLETAKFEKIPEFIKIGETLYNAQKKNKYTKKPKVLSGEIVEIYYWYDYSAGYRATIKVRVGDNRYSYWGLSDRLFTDKNKALEALSDD